jgi:hypothetical protein
MVGSCVSTGVVVATWSSRNTSWVSPLYRNQGLLVVQLKEPFHLQGVEHASCEYLAGASFVYERTIVTLDIE